MPMRTPLEHRTKVSMEELESHLHDQILPLLQSRFHKPGCNQDLCTASQCASQFKIVSIKHNQNPFLWRAYLAHLDLTQRAFEDFPDWPSNTEHMRDHRDKDLAPYTCFSRELNEGVHKRILFHGVPSLDQALNISINGFDEGSVKERCLFCPGFYHSDMLCKSLLY
eukprot:2784491-Rhodomonas_salina.2